MKTIILRKNTGKEMFVICCLMCSWFMNCASTPVGSVESDDQNLNNKFLGEIYIDKKQRFSIVIPKGWKIKDWKIKYKDDELDSLFLMGLMAEYNVDSNGSLFHVNTSIPISKFVDEAFTEAKQLGSLIAEPQRGNITINTTDLQGEYIKILTYQENGKKIFWQKVYYIPHRIGNTIMMITCSTLLPDDNVDLDMIFDKFVKTFNWMR